MKYKELQDKSIHDLYGALETMKRELFNLRLLRGTGQSEAMGSPMKFRRLRRDIARVQTKISELRLKKESN